jgi:hypothetical protein
VRTAEIAKILLQRSPSTFLLSGDKFFNTPLHSLFGKYGPDDANEAYQIARMYLNFADARRKVNRRGELPYMRAAIRWPDSKDLLRFLKSHDHIFLSPPPIGDEIDANAGYSVPVQLEQSYSCPISRMPFTNPVLLSDGYTVRCGPATSGVPQKS